MHSIVQHQDWINLKLIKVLKLDFDTRGHPKIWF